MAGLLLAIIYLCFVSLGLPDSLLGSGWPVMQIDLGVASSAMGIVTMIISLGTIVASLFSDKLTARLGTWAVTAVSILLTALGLLGFAFSKHFWMLCIFAIPYGLGAGAIDASLNNYVALHYTGRHMSWLHCFWGVGAIVSPYVMSFCLANQYGWDTGYLSISITQFVILAVMLASFPLWKKKGNVQMTEEEISAKLTFKQKFKINGVVFLLLAFLCYCAYEATLMTWTSSYLVLAKGMSEERAAAFASLFFIGITAGRFVAGFVTNKLGDKRLIRIGIAIVTLGLILLFVPTANVNVSLAGFIIIGLGCAPIYPSIIHSTPYNFGKQNSQAIIGLEMAFAYVGSTFAPPLYGLLSTYVNAKALPIYLAVFVIAFVVLIEVVNKKAKQNNTIKTQEYVRDLQA